MPGVAFDRLHEVVTLHLGGRADLQRDAGGAVADDALQLLPRGLGPDARDASTTDGTDASLSSSSSVTMCRGSGSRRILDPTQEHQRREADGGDDEGRLVHRGAGGQPDRGHEPEACRGREALDGEAATWIAPAPRKPMPETTEAAMREKSAWAKLFGL